MAIAIGIGGFYLVMLSIIVYLIRRAPCGKEIPGVGFVRTDEKGRPLK